MTLNGARDELGIWRQLVQARSFDQAMCEHNPHWHEARGEEAVIVGGFAGLEVTDVVAPHFRGACAVALLRGSTPEQLAANVFGTYEVSRWGTGAETSAEPQQQFHRNVLGLVGHIGVVCDRSRPSPQTTIVRSHCGMRIWRRDRQFRHRLRIDEHSVDAPTSDRLHLSEQPVCDFIAGISRNCGQRRLARARACGMPAVDVDGNDVDDVIRNRNQAVERARHGAGPSFIHAKTYRLGGHYMTDPEVYRTAEEVSCWEARDPLTRYRDSLADKGVLSHKEAQEHIASENQQMLEIIAEAKQEREHDLLNRSPYSEDWRAAS